MGQRGSSATTPTPFAALYGSNGVPIIQHIQDATDNASASLRTISNCCQPTLKDIINVCSKVSLLPLPPPSAATRRTQRGKAQAEGCHSLELVASDGGCQK